jgi:charged multivesicular body protein 3
MQFLFGAKKQDPAELAKEWRRNLQHEARSIDRDIVNLGRAEQKALVECKKLAKGGNVKAAKVLAKEVVNTRHAVARMHTAKAQMNSVAMMLQTAASTIKLQGCVSKSAEIMAAMNALVKLPELQATMSAMSREMMRAGLIEETISDTFDMMEPEGLDAAADREVDKIIQELTAGVLDKAAPAPTSKIAAPAAAAAAVGAGSAVDQTVSALISDAEAAAVASAEEAELKAMQHRLQSL